MIAGIYYIREEESIRKIIRLATSHRQRQGLLVRETAGKAGQLYLYLLKTYPQQYGDFKETFWCSGPFVECAYLTYIPGIGNVAYYHRMDYIRVCVITEVVPLSAYTSSALLPHKIVKHI